MAYSVGGKIEAADYNGFLTTFNAAWATGTGSSGYGQPTFPTVAVGDLVRARPATVNAGSPPTWSSTPEWRTLINSINAASNHQTGAAAIATGDFAASSAFPVATTAASGLIAYGSTVSAAITTVSGTQRLSATAQGASTSTVNTSTATWVDYLQFAWTVTFASHDAARFFFNSGGQIGAQASHPGAAAINGLINDLCSDAGTVWLSSTNGTPVTVSLAGTSYNGITKVGGANPGGVTISANNGFYALVAAPTNVFTQTSDFVYAAYSGTNYKINLSYNGAGVVGFTVLIDEVPNGATVNAGTVSTLIIRPPDATYLADTWGVPTVACTRTSV
jgi:hypothetical protein